MKIQRLKFKIRSFFKNKMIHLMKNSLMLQVKKLINLVHQVAKLSKYKMLRNFRNNHKFRFIAQAKNK